MLSFASDYTEGAHPKILERFAERNLVTLQGYGSDPDTEEAKRKICAACGRDDLQIQFLTGGTQTNLIAVSSMLRSYEVVVAADTGHVNTQEIIQAMPEYNKAKTEIDALQAQYEADLKSMQDELQKKGEAFDKEQASLPENIKQRRQTELQEMYQKIQQSYQDNQQALQKASAEKMQAIQAKVMEAVNAIGKDGGYVYIMELGSQLYISSTLSTDVTAQVKAKLGLK